MKKKSKFKVGDRIALSDGKHGKIKTVEENGKYSVAVEISKQYYESDIAFSNDELEYNKHIRELDAEKSGLNGYIKLKKITINTSKKRINSNTKRYEKILNSIIENPSEFLTKEHLSKRRNNFALINELLYKIKCDESRIREYNGYINGYFNQIKSIDKQIKEEKKNYLIKQLSGIEK